MKGAGNVATSTARPGGNPISRHALHSIPDASSNSRMRVSCCSARSGQTKQECNTKAQNLNLRCCGWLDFHEKKHTDRKSPFLLFPLLCFSILLLLSIQVMLRKASFCWTFYTFTPPPIPHCNLAVYPIKICVSWHSNRVEHN